MKVFLSHSSKDKGFVAAVAAMLRPGTYELDSITFDAGIINSDAIQVALKRSDLFCLFLSENSVKSSYVEFETLLGTELLARGHIHKFLVICLDSTSFEKASDSAKLFNFVRRITEPEAAARLIQGCLISTSAKNLDSRHPFIGREEELLEVEKQLTDHGRPETKMIYISGNFGAGRRSIAREIYKRLYPQVASYMPSISLNEFCGIDDIYREVLAVLRPSMPALQFRTRLSAFLSSDEREKAALVAQLLNSLLPANEAAFILDKGGALIDSGALTKDFESIIGFLDSAPHPPIAVIAPRMVPMRFRRDQDDISYLAVKSFTRDASERLIGRLLKEKSMPVTREQISQLVTLADGHPFNIYRMIDELGNGIDVFLGNPRNFIIWKHRLTSEYLKKIHFSDTEIRVLALLAQIPELDFTEIFSAVELDSGDASEALQRLMSLHIVESATDRFLISPALRIAVERDQRIVLSRDTQASAMQSIAKSLSVRLEDGTAPIALVDAAILSSLEAGASISPFSAVFLLPSHHVSMAKKYYDRRKWSDSIRLAKDALRSSNRLSISGLVAACRFMCLAAARLGQTEIFDEGIKKLEAITDDDWVKSNTAFLRGFNLRLKGNLPEAEKFLRRSHELAPGNFSAMREIASICLARGNLDESERFAREAHNYARSNAYLVDILLSVLIRKHGGSSRSMSEIHELFDLLEIEGEEGGKSFFTTRKAEFEHLWGSNKAALTLIEKAISKTPNIFEPRRIQAKALLKDGNKTKAFEVITVMRDMVNSKNPDERRSNYRLYLETYAEYLADAGQYSDAKQIYQDDQLFTQEEKAQAIREIDMIKAYKINAGSR